MRPANSFSEETSLSALCAVEDAVEDADLIAERAVEEVAGELHADVAVRREVVGDRALDEVSSAPDWSRSRLKGGLNLPARSFASGK